MESSENDTLFPRWMLEREMDFPRLYSEVFFWVDFFLFMDFEIFPLITERPRERPEVAELEGFTGSS